MPRPATLITGLLCSATWCAACVDHDRGAAPFVPAAPDTHASLADTIAPDTLVPADTAPAAVVLPQGQAASFTVRPTPATAVHALGRDTLLIADGDGWFWRDAVDERPVSWGELAPRTAPPRAVARMPGQLLPESFTAEVYLVADADGALLLLSESSASATPLGAAIAAPVTSVVAAEDAVWLATDLGLQRLRAQTLTPFTATGHALGGATLAWGPPLGQAQTTGTLWLAVHGDVFALVEDADAGTALLWPEQTGLAVQQISATRGRVCVAPTGGGEARVLCRTAAGWSETRLPEAAMAVRSHEDADGSWIIGVSGRLFHDDGDALSEVVGGPASGAAWAAGPAGTLLVAGPQGVVELSPGRVISVTGLRERELLEAPTRVRVRASEPESAAVTATVNGIPLTLTELPAGADDGARWEAVIDPQALETGDQTLSVDVAWPASERAEAEAQHVAIAFRVRHTTWTADVAPLYERRCSDCHSPLQGASTAVLDHPEAWRERIDCILCRVNSPFDRSLPACQVCDDGPSSMPPTGAIAPWEATVIRAWRDDGFRKE